MIMKLQVRPLIIISVILVSILINTLQSLAQETKLEIKKLNYISWTYTGADVLKGELLELREESIVVRNNSQRLDLQLLEVDINQIQWLKFRRKGSVGRGVLYGALGGIATGALIGFMSGNDPPGTFIAFSASDKAIVLGTLLAIPGVAIGAILGTSRIKIPIENKQSKYVEQKKRLEEYRR